MTIHQKNKSASFRLKKVAKRIAKPNIRVFSICLTLSFVLWIFQSMGREYTSGIELEITYTNLPEDQTFVRPSADKLKLKVVGVGWDLLGYHLKIDKPTYPVDLSLVKSNGQISLVAAKDLIIEAIPGISNILNLQPEYVEVSLEKAISKKVPVVSKIELIPATGFGFSYAYPIPDSVEIFGAASKIAAIQEIYTDSGRVENAQGELSQKYNLNLPAGVEQISETEVIVNALIEPLTEKEVESSIQVRGYKGSKKVIIYPSLATVILQTTQSQFNKIESSDFVVYVDFTKADYSGSELLKVEVENNSQFVKNYRIHPKYVDFIIQN